MIRCPALSELNLGRPLAVLQSISCLKTVTNHGYKISSTGLIIKKVKLAGQEIITIELQEVEDASVVPVVAAAVSEPSPPPAPPAAVPASTSETRLDVTPTSTATQRPTPSTSPPNTMTGNLFTSKNPWYYLPMVPLIYTTVILIFNE
ncbi:unnamed protein product [Phyllotreta striolata]|uniref:Uncharacterized protein n=1 Tax=Phyllotreta striolata TaxID=444603 RepID=A0A9N9TI74_PHYSR|nr:unnamed protein product [Phyllotreta striolata]